MLQTDPARKLALVDAASSMAIPRRALLAAVAAMRGA
jgi:hypothetical protein